MSSASFDTFFHTATGKPPYGYQCRLACGPDAKLDEPASLEKGTDCQSKLIDIPTGLGKTAAVVMAWLWNRLGQPNEAERQKWPRRLVYCLPMRTLVEQTEAEVRKWLEKHGLLWDNEPKTRKGKVGVHILMGGEDSGEWDIYPEENAILIGTQDMLLSRALNRGYGMSRYRWPMHFGLLNNDCLWVMDETQLMGPGLATACQLEAFRMAAPQGFDAYGSNGSVTWYMSATSNPEHLDTREWRGVSRPSQFRFGLSPEEKDATSGPIHQRRFAVKLLTPVPQMSFSGATSAGLVADIISQHLQMVARTATLPEAPARTLVICNTVDRAKEVYRQLVSKRPDGCDLVLLHSRFRPPERRDKMTRLRAVNSGEFRTAFPGGQIVVSTQVIEAGVDISSGVLWSEVAPLASLVQRLGRLNRAGEFNKSAWQPSAFIVGIGVKPAPPRESKEARERREKDNTGCCLPYEQPACASAWTGLRNLNGNASPASLEQISADIGASIPLCPYSLQRHELLDFFDTDANLSLGFTDVSPFVRGLDDDTDLQVLWRERWLQKDGEDGIGEPGFRPNFQRDEVCPVPISKRRDPEAMEVLSRGWLWRGKESGCGRQERWCNPASSPRISGK